MHDIRLSFSFMAKRQLMSQDDWCQLTDIEGMLSSSSAKKAWSSAKKAWYSYRSLGASSTACGFTPGDWGVFKMGTATGVGWGDANWAVAMVGGCNAPTGGVRPGI